MNNKINYNKSSRWERKQAPCIDDLQCGQQVAQSLQLSSLAIKRQDQLGQRQRTVGWWWWWRWWWWCYEYSRVIQWWVSPTWYSIQHHYDKTTLHSHITDHWPLTWQLATTVTRGSATAEEPRDALRQLKYYGRFLTELLTRSSIHRNHASTLSVEIV